MNYVKLLISRWQVLYIHQIAARSKQWIVVKQNIRLQQSLQALRCEFSHYQTIVHVKELETSSPAYGHHGVCKCIDLEEVCQGQV